MAVAHKATEVQGFVNALEPGSQRESALYLAYFVEVVREEGSFTPGAVRDAFVEARVPVPRNVSAALSQLRSTKDIMPLHGTRYALTQQGLARVTERLNSVRWFTSVSAEPTRLVREVSEKLQQDVLRIVSADEREFLEEAISCLHPTVNAYRAAVIMGWSSVVYNLRQKILTRGLAAVNGEVQKHYPKKKIRRAEEMEDLKDSELLVVGQGLGVLNKNVKARLDSHLGLRNACAHPTSVQPQIHTVRAFFEEIIQYVLAVP